MNQSKSDEKRKLKMIEDILNHPVPGEVYIETSGRIWKELVLRHFNKLERKELTLMELVKWLETKESVKYSQKYELVKYPIIECIKYISKVTKRPITIIE
ncbi:hypothetical protein AWM68_17505 [Fictibacillus phosphorivorans]|uniref:Uncharacterized protein n=1 Tax=Fictibacillus phosphorivorans TaxID=1221500 RepID=A0A163S1Q6_9BACL|nr:hypothetical protein [Fictibacillus phosphorivorans]KZE67969.1 hypothetical protein AWM68_17505 [Fictibacillus phosphorivorans]